MYINEGFIAKIVPLTPSGTNSTLFTECCGAAICDDQAKCPRCNRNVVGYDADTNHERGKLRWRNATRHWSRKI